MCIKTFRNKHVEKAYLENDGMGCLAIHEHCWAGKIPCSPFADDTGTIEEMKRPDLLIDRKPAEVQVARSWKNRGYPKYWRRVMIFKRKMHQRHYEGGSWWTVNALGSHALILPFDSEPIGEGIYYDRTRQTREPVVYFSLKDCELIELGKLNTGLN